MEQPGLAPFLGAAQLHWLLRSAPRNSISKLEFGAAEFISSVRQERINAELELGLRMYKSRSTLVLGHLVPKSGGSDLVVMSPGHLRFYGSTLGFLFPDHQSASCLSLPLPRRFAPLRPPSISGHRSASGLRPVAIINLRLRLGSSSGISSLPTLFLSIDPLSTTIDLTPPQALLQALRYVRLESQNDLNFSFSCKRDKGAGFEAVWLKTIKNSGPCAKAWGSTTRKACTGTGREAERRGGRHRDAAWHAFVSVFFLREEEADANGATLVVQTDAAGQCRGRQSSDQRSDGRIPWIPNHHYLSKVAH
ncbi:hypothetical protein KSP40_PGU009980 [Platanthera guangdongensis]|uniref:Uncharacterized protein n=1 Tax=Platanthera guangdongensis TaxID=2320717 RepID=A0ABR2ML75_9ASPA